MPDRVIELPGGRVVAFPDTMSDAEITAAIEADLGSATDDTATAPRHPHAQFPGMVKDFVVGAGKELAEQGIRGGQLLRKIPGVGLLDHLIKPIEVNTQPTNATQRAGGTALNAAEVMAPTKALTSLGLNVLPRIAAQGAAGAGTAALQGKNPLVGAVASMAPTAALGGMDKVGPVIARNAPAISQAASQLPGNSLVAGIASGRPIAGMVSSAASAVARDPRVIRGAGNLAARVGNSEAAEAISRAALLQALAEEPASAVP